MYLINDTRLEEQLDAAASGYTPDNNSIPPKSGPLLPAILRHSSTSMMMDCYDHTAEPDDQQQTVITALYADSGTAAGDTACAGTADEAHRPRQPDQQGCRWL